MEKVSISTKLKILIVIDYYYPGFMAGGPPKSVKNMVDVMKENYDFYILTQNHDLNSENIYKEIEPNTWIKNDGIFYYYCTKKKWNICTFHKLIKNNSFRIIYLNSIFSLISTISLILLMKLIFKKNKIIIATRGQLLPNALKIRSKIKRLYLIMFKILIPKKNTIFQASSIIEEQFNKNLIGNNYNHVVIPNFISRKTEIDLIEDNSPVKTLKLVWLSRIHPIKNLEFLIELIDSLEIPIQFDIYGVIENNKYFEYISEKINSTNDSVIKYKGAINPDQVLEILRCYNLFVFPSKSENFGQVIVEALSAGLKVIISNNTPWKTSQKNEIVSLPLKKSLWRNEIENTYSLSIAELNNLKINSIRFYKGLSDEMNQKSLNLFEKLLNRDICVE